MLHVLDVIEISLHLSLVMFLPNVLTAFEYLDYFTVLNLSFDVNCRLNLENRITILSAVVLIVLLCSLPSPLQSFGRNSLVL